MGTAQKIPTYLQIVFKTLKLAFLKDKNLFLFGLRLFEAQYLNGLFAFFDKRTKYGENNQNKVMQDYHRFFGASSKPHELCISYLYPLCRLSMDEFLSTKASFSSPCEQSRLRRLLPFVGSCVVS